MGWRFPWVSSFGNDFNFDYHVSFRPEELERKEAYYNYATIDPGIDELPGMSVFAKDDGGAIYHTYSSYVRGGEALMGAFMLLALVPKGRNEQDAFMQGVDRQRVGVGEGVSVGVDLGGGRIRKKTRNMMTITYY